jgi:hypothetical protein
MCMISLPVVHHHQSVRRNIVTLWTSKDIPAGIPMSWKLMLLPLNMRFLDVLFVFVGQMVRLITYRHLPRLLILQRRRRFPLIRPDGYKDWS